MGNKAQLIWPMLWSNCILTHCVISFPRYHKKSLIMLLVPHSSLITTWIGCGHYCNKTSNYLFHLSSNAVMLLISNFHWVQQCLIVHGWIPIKYWFYVLHSFIFLPFTLLSNCIGQQLTRKVQHDQALFFL